MKPDPHKLEPVIKQLSHSPAPRDAQALGDAAHFSEPLDSGWQRLSTPLPDAGPVKAACGYCLGHDLEGSQLTGAMHQPIDVPRKDPAERLLTLELYSPSSVPGLSMRYYAGQCPDCHTVYWRYAPLARRTP